MTRTVHNVMPPNVTYELTPMGAVMLEAATPLLQWSTEYLRHRPTVGDEVTVSYPADAPEQARRIPRFDWFGWAVIAVGSGIGGLELYDFVRAAQRSAAGGQSKTLL